MATDKTRLDRLEKAVLPPASYLVCYCDKKPGDLHKAGCRAGGELPPNIKIIYVRYDRLGSLQLQEA